MQIIYDVEYIRIRSFNVSNTNVLVLTLPMFGTYASRWELKVEM